MKLSAFLLASIASSSWAFVPTVTSPAFKNVMKMAEGNSEPVDYSMKGIDAEGSFDPTTGENPALIRNNNDGVWVSQ
eukprot:7358831-Ditylum_brightwellii.AAC.1